MGEPSRILFPISNQSIARSYAFNSRMWKEAGIRPTKSARLQAIEAERVSILGDIEIGAYNLRSAYLQGTMAWSAGVGIGVALLIGEVFQSGLTGPQDWTLSLLGGALACSIVILFRRQGRDKLARSIDFSVEEQTREVNEASQRRVIEIEGRSAD